MPTGKKKSLLENVKFAFLALVFAALFIFLGYYIYLYSNIDATKTNIPTTSEGYSRTTVELEDNQQILSHKYPLETNFPDFIIRTKGEVPSEYGRGFDLVEGYNVKIVSTNKFSKAEIKDPSGEKVLAEVLQLEVYIDDEDNYLEVNEPFNVALSVFLAGNKEVNVSQGWFLSILHQEEMNRLREDFLNGRTTNSLTDEEITLHNEEIDKADKAFEEKYAGKDLSQDEVEALFESIDSWIIVPYVKDEFTEYEEDNGGGNAGGYTLLLSEYYGGKDSEFIDKVLSKGTSTLKEPVLVTNLYVDR
jgi:hypothetical protein